MAVVMFASRTIACGFIMTRQLVVVMRTMILARSPMLRGMMVIMLMRMAELDDADGHPGENTEHHQPCQQSAHGDEKTP